MTHWKLLRYRHNFREFIYVHMYVCNSVHVCACICLCTVCVSVVCACICLHACICMHACVYGMLEVEILSVFEEKQQPIQLQLPSFLSPKASVRSQPHSSPTEEPLLATESFESGMTVLCMPSPFKDQDGHSMLENQIPP